MRVAIIGNSGSGKTTLAHRLASGSDYTVLDLDSIAWEPDQVAVPRPVEEALSDVKAFCKSVEHWVAEGCYASLIEVALEFNPHLLVLDPGLERCVENCQARPWEPHKYSSTEEQDANLPFLLNWVEDYYSRGGDMSLVAHTKVFELYTGPKQWLAELPGPGFELSDHLSSQDA